MNYVGFFKILRGRICNVMFLDAQITGHNAVGVIAGIYTSAHYKEVSDDNLNYANNVHVLNSYICGNESVSGFFGKVDLMQPKESTVTNIFGEVTIESNDGIAYGFANIPKRTRYNTVNSSSDVPYYINIDGIPVNCDSRNPGNCWGWNGETRKTHFINCVMKIHKHDTISSYYGFCSFENKDEFVKCYVDNSETSPSIQNGATYKNITDIQHEIDLLPNIDSNYFTKKVNAALEPKFLNNDAIYLQFDNGYHVYDFANNEFVQKYTKFSNENSKEIIQNGMDKVSFSKIPNSKLKEIQDKYGKVKVINCINAHKKIVYKTSVLEMGRDKAHSVYRKKIRFNDFNEITSIKKK